MKTKWLKILRSIIIVTALGNFLALSAADSSWREQFDQGLIQEEVHQNLEKAVEYYQGIVSTYDEQRSVLAMSLYRLAECLRKLGRMDEAAPLYERITKEFQDQESLVLLSKRFVAEAVPLPIVKVEGKTIINQSDSLKQLIHELQYATPDAAMQALTQTTGDAIAGILLKQYLEAQTELVQLKTQYREKWPGIKNQRAKIASLEEQMKEHVEESIKTLKLRLVTLTGKMQQSTSTHMPFALLNEQAFLEQLVLEMEAKPTDDEIRIFAETIGNSQLIKLLDNKIQTLNDNKLKAAEILQIEVNTEKVDENIEHRLRDMKLLHELEEARLDRVLDLIAKEINRSVGMANVKIELLKKARSKSLSNVEITTQDFRGKDSSILDNPRSLRLFIDELEKAPAEVALRMLEQETDLKIPSEFHSEKISIQLKIINLRNLGEEHPLKKSEKAKLAAIQEQEADVVKHSIQQLEIKLRVLERTSELSKEINAPQKTPEQMMLGDLQKKASDKPDLLTHIPQTGSGSMAPIHQAAVQDFVSVIDFLIEHGVDVNSRDGSGRTALHHAVSRGSLEVVKHLIELKGIDLNALEPYHSAPLHIASQKGFFAITEALVKAGADVNQRSALNAAINSPIGWVDRRLMTQLRDGLPTNRDRASHSYASNPELYAALLTEGNASLHYSSLYGFTELCELFIANGANVNATNRCGLTPLLYLLAHSKIEPNRQLETAKLLLNEGADPNVLGCVKNPAQPFSQRLGKESVYFKKLHHSGLSVAWSITGSGFEELKFNDPDLPVGWTSPLHIATIISDELSRLLLDNGANINQQDYRGWTPVYELMTHDIESSIRDQMVTLVSGGNTVDPMIHNMNLDLKDDMGYRAMDLGILLERHIDAVKGMMTLLPDDKREQIAFEIFWNHLPLVYRPEIGRALPDLLPNFAAIISEPGPDGLTPLEYAVEHENLSICEWLSEQGVAGLMTPKLQNQLEQLEKTFQHVENVLKTVPNQARPDHERKQLEILNILRSFEDPETP